MASPDLDARRPEFSVVVPTHRRPGPLDRCLDALISQDYPPDAYEVLVVDDARSDDACTVIDRFSDRTVPAIRLLSTLTRGGPAGARNAGAAAARGRFLAFTDDDCQPAADWLTRLASYLHDAPACAVGGLTTNMLPAVIYSTASQMLIDYLYDYYHADVTGRRFFTSSNLALAADTFRDLGGFDETFPLAAAEDREFCERWQRSGRQLRYAEDVVVRHAHEMDFRAFLRQHFNYGRGADFLHRSRARYDGSATAPRLEPPSFYVNLVTFPLARGLTWRTLALAGLMGASQVAYGAGYFTERLGRGRRR